MRRFAVCFALSLLTGCVGPAIRPNGVGHESAHGGSERLAGGVVCHVGPNGGAVVADRGIGGTGAPLITGVPRNAGVPRSAEISRSAGASRIADRGIGGTGIVGVITGFASICVNGLEVRYDESSSVDIDGTPGSIAALRAGQLVVIAGQGPRTAPFAQKIIVRHEVVGKIEAVDPTSGVVTIAGQSVLIDNDTRDAYRFRVGDWVAVSGLRRLDGMIVGNRLDDAPTHDFLARGRVVRDGATVRVGALTLNGTAAENLRSGEFVSVSGRYWLGQTEVRAVARDASLADPGAGFGASVQHLTVQAFVHVAKGSVAFNGLEVEAGAGVHARPDRDGVAIVSMERKPDGSFAATTLRYTDDHGRALPATRSAARPRHDAGPVASHPTHEPNVSPESVESASPEANEPSVEDAPPVARTPAETGETPVATAPPGGDTPVVAKEIPVAADNPRLDRPLTLASVEPERSLATARGRLGVRSPVVASGSFDPPRSVAVHAALVIAPPTSAATIATTIAPADGSFGSGTASDTSVQLASSIRDKMGGDVTARRFTIDSAVRQRLRMEAALNQRPTMHPALAAPTISLVTGAVTIPGAGTGLSKGIASGAPSFKPVPVVVGDGAIAH